MSSGGGGTQTSTTVEKSDPWVGIQPHLLDIAEQSGGLAPRSYFPGSTVTPFSQYTNEYINSGTNRAITGPEYNPASRNLIGTLNGDYLGPNPYADAAFGAGANAVRGQVDSAFGRSGRTGSGMHQAVMQQGMNDLAGKFYFDNYANERENQMQALGLAPSIDEMGWNDMSKLADIGSLYEGKQGEYLQDSINRWNFAQEEPYEYLRRKSDIIQGVGGKYSSGTGSTTSPAPRQSTGAQAAGYATIALSLLGALSSRKFKHDFGPAARILPV